MVVGVQNILKIALGNATLGAKVLNHGLAAADQSCLTGFESFSAVSETSVRVAGEVRSALSDLLSDVMARMSSSWSKESRCRKGDERKREVDHLKVIPKAPGDDVEA